MNNILSKEEVCFNSLEKGVFDFVCGIGRYITESILIGQDKELHQKLKKKYRNKGYAITVRNNGDGDNYCNKGTRHFAINKNIRN